MEFSISRGSTFQIYHPFKKLFGENAEKKIFTSVHSLNYFSLISILCVSDGVEGASLGTEHSYFFLF